MIKSYIKWFPAVLLVAVAGLIGGVVMHAKNAAQVQQCGTKLSEVRQLISPTFRSTCTTAKSMAGVGTGVMVLCGVVGLVVIVAGIAHIMGQGRMGPVQPL